MKYEEIKKLYTGFERSCPPKEIETSQGIFVESDADDSFST